MVRFTQDMADEEAPPNMISSREEEKVLEDEDDDTSRPKSAKPILHNPRGELTRGLSTLSGMYDLTGTGKLNFFERMARKADANGSGTVDSKEFVWLMKVVMTVSTVCFVLLATTIGSSIGLYVQTQHQGNDMVHTIQENAVMDVATDGLGVTHLTDKFGHVVATKATHDVYPTIQRFDTTDNNRVLNCVSTRVAAEMVHSVASGTAVSVAVLDENGLEKEVMPLSDHFSDTGNVLQFGAPGTVGIGIILDSDACNVAAVEPLIAAPEDDVKLGDIEEPEAKANDTAGSSNMFDTDTEGVRHLVGDSSLPTSASSQTVLAKHRALYTNHRAALHAGTKAKRNLAEFTLQLDQGDYDNFDVGAQGNTGGDTDTFVLPHGDPIFVISSLVLIMPSTTTNIFSVSSMMGSDIG